MAGSRSSRARRPDSARQSPSSQNIVKDAESGAQGKESAGLPLKGNTLYLRVKVSKDSACRFSYSADGVNFTPIGDPFTARKGKWIGARLGIFTLRTGQARETGYADFDWFRIE